MSDGVREKRTINQPEDDAQALLLLAAPAVLLSDLLREAGVQAVELRCQCPVPSFTLELVREPVAQKHSWGESLSTEQIYRCLRCERVR